MNAGDAGSRPLASMSSASVAGSPPSVITCAKVFSFGCWYANIAEESTTTIQRRFGSRSAMGRIRSTYSWSSATKIDAPPSFIWYSSSSMDAVG